MGGRRRDLVADAAAGAALTGRALCLGAVGIGRARKSGPLRVCALPGPSSDLSPSDRPNIPVSCISEMQVEAILGRKRLRSERAL